MLAENWVVPYLFPYLLGALVIIGLTVTMLGVRRSRRQHGDPVAVSRPAPRNPDGTVMPSAEDGRSGSDH